MAAPSKPAGPNAQQVITNAQAYMARYDLAFQVSPIFLQGGIASNAPGQIVPIITLYNQLTLYTQFTTTGLSFDLEGNQIVESSASYIAASAFFARYLPMPGSTLIDNQIGMYPFANQQVAANAIVVQPLKLSMMMIVPVNQPGGYLTRLSTFTALVTSLTNHNIAGGTYAIATPSFIYGPLVMTGMTDATNTESHQVQIQYQLDFIQPLITNYAATAAQNGFMARVTAGQSFTGTPGWNANQTALIQPSTNAMIGGLQQYGVTPGNITQNATQ